MKTVSKALFKCCWYQSGEDVIAYETNFNDEMSNELKKLYDFIKAYFQGCFSVVLVILGFVLFSIGRNGLPQIYYLPFSCINLHNPFQFPK